MADGTPAQFDIRSYLNDLRTEYWEAGHNVAHGWLGIRCIYCNDTHNHLGINLVYKNYSCWLCKMKGNIVDLIQDLEGITYREAKERIDDYQSLEPEEAVERERLDDHGQDILPKGTSKEFTPAMLDYLRTTRRYDPEILIPDWDLRAGPWLGTWKYRIIIPVTLHSRIMTWIGMSTVRETGAIKYLAASVEESIIPSSELIYGVDHVRRNVVIVEGVTDAWRIGKGAVATLGIGAAAMSAKIRRLLDLNAERYFVMFDKGTPEKPEEQAQANADNLAQLLKMSGKQVEILDLDRGDPDEMPDDEAQALRRDLGL